MAEMMKKKEEDEEEEKKKKQKLDLMKKAGAGDEAGWTKSVGIEVKNVYEAVVV